MVVAELFAKLGLKVDKKSWSVGNDVIAGLGKALAVWMGVKAIQGIGGWVKATMEAGDAAVKTAQKVGISTDAVQELGYAAGQSGSNVEGITGAMNKFSKSMQDVKTGKEPVVGGLRDIGLSFRDVKSTIAREGLDAALEQIADRFKAMPDGAKKGAAAVDIFGKSGRELIPLLNAGGAGIRELRQEARDLGVVIDEADAKSLEGFGDTIDRIKSALIGFRNQAVTALLPVLQEMATKLINWLKDADNRQRVISVMTSLINGLATACRIAASVIAFVVEHWEMFVAILAGTAVVTAFVRIIKLFQFLALASTRAAVTTLAAWAAAALPFVAIALVVAGIALALTKYRKQTMQVIDTIKKKAKELWDALPKGFKMAFELIANLPIISQLIWLVKNIRDLPGAIKGAAKRFISGTEEGRAQWADKFGLKGEDREKFIKGDNAALGMPKTSSDVLAPGTAAKPIGSGGPLSMTFGDIHVTPPAGADAQQYAEAVKSGIRDEWGKQMRQAMAGTGVA